MCYSSDSDCTSLQYPTMVPKTLKPLCQGTSAAARGTRNSDKLIKHYPHIDGGDLIDTNGLVGFRKTLLCEGILENASHIITNSRRKSTLSSYESASRKWSSWCLERKIDPFQAPVKDIIEYLTFLFNYGNQYITINLHRSAIPAFHEYIGGLPLGKHPRICSLVSGVFNLRTLKPRYMFAWNVKQVLGFLKQTFGDNDQLWNKELTILLALTASSGISALHILDLNHMIKTSKYYEFIGKLHKSWRRGESPLSLKIYALPPDKALCVVAALDCYIKRT